MGGLGLATHLNLIRPRDDCCPCRSSNISIEIMVPSSLNFFQRSLVLHSLGRLNSEIASDSQCRHVDHCMDGGSSGGRIGGSIAAEAMLLAGEGYLIGLGLDLP